MNEQASNPDTVQASLRKSVAKALERKRRLGQYAVVWRNGKPQRIEPDHHGWPVNQVVRQHEGVQEGQAEYTAPDNSRDREP